MVCCCSLAGSSACKTCPNNIQVVTDYIYKELDISQTMQLTATDHEGYLSIIGALNKHIETLRKENKELKEENYQLKKEKSL